MVCLSGVPHTEIKSFLAGGTSHVLPSPCAACPEGRRTRVTQWLETTDETNDLSTGTKQNKHSKHQRGTPSLFHTQKHFPVVQPAVVVRVSENLAEQRNTTIRMNVPHLKRPVINHIKDLSPSLDSPSSCFPSC